jgi:hypothetical protein
MISKMFIAAGAVCAFAAPAAAQSYDGEIDCGGVWAQGDSVPFTVRFEEQAFQQHTIQVGVRITRPDGQQKSLLNQTFVLNANQDREFTRFINLTANSLTGSYDLTLNASDGSLVVGDTCSFDVI